MVRSADRLLCELPAAAGQGVSAVELAELVSRAVAPVVAHDAARLDGTNPAAGFVPGAFGFWHGYEPDFGRALLRNFYAAEDPCLPDDLVRRAVPVGVLGTGGGAGRGDPSLRRLLLDNGVGCELRLLLRDARGVWGLLGLLREQGGKPFSVDDVHRIAGLGPSLIEALRGYATAGPLSPAVPALPTAVLVLGPDHRVRAATPQARQWTAQIAERRPIQPWIAEAFITGLSLRARACARDPSAAPPLVCTPSTSYGRWVAFQGQPLDEDGNGDVAIIIQAATGAQVLPAFCDWYGITARERQIVGDLLDGALPKQIARRRHLSVHTVNDHLRTVFRKTGAGCRAELVAAITG